MPDHTFRMRVTADRARGAHTKCAITQPVTTQIVQVSIEDNNISCSTASRRRCTHAQTFVHEARLTSPGTNLKGYQQLTNQLTIPCSMRN